MLISVGVDVNILLITDDIAPAAWFAVKWDFPDVLDKLLKGKLSWETLRAALKAAFSISSRIWRGS